MWVLKDMICPSDPAILGRLLAVPSAGGDEVYLLVAVRRPHRRVRCCAVAFCCLVS